MNQLANLSLTEDIHKKCSDGSPFKEILKMHMDAYLCNLL